ncbi:tRNA methyltransferase [Neisseria animaloris]|uniref:23S rRNA (uracil(1939)-C(5))-methyltransferase RlmD n=1 Tax=Neisseria animaloris TaxID=326522 RepID=UPI000A18EAB2|nr:23S rRNA (uracil(1939)-C(5))-methyltransferase RlmD [Neisseria animaloris]OSI06963.1 23S rRNA (uracil(1939)-C(5))-methyltransferase [Neisseria animaloris]VEH88079.1 tRNA methyltransferase [Neisseria animaloris]
MKSENIAEVFSLDYEGRGVARVNGKTVFIKGALPSEQVIYRLTRSKKQFDEAETVAVIKASAERVEPKCCYFDTCGGCVLQHASPSSQIAFKQRILEEQLLRIGKVLPQQLLSPIYGMPWAYRHRARLSVSVNREGRLKLGFQSRKTHDVVNAVNCPVLPKHVSNMLPELRNLLQNCADRKERVHHIEFLIGEQVTVLNVCIENEPSESTKQRLRKFSDGLNKTNVQEWQIWLQYGEGKAFPFYPEQAPQLTYSLPEFGVQMPFRPGDFTQINPHLNALMVSRALRLLDIKMGERVADLFCGLGNFSIPMAKQGADVVGIEGADFLTQRASENARLNNCGSKTSFQTADLFETDAATVASWGVFDKMLLDPPRSGAYAVVQALHKPYLPKRIVYVSCNPSTFARDAAVLVDKGYCFKAAGVMNMFAQTAHVESIGCFELH